jgi:hypothetical protein
MGGRDYSQSIIATPVISKSNRKQTTNVATLTIKATNSNLLSANSQLITVDQTFTKVGGGVPGQHTSAPWGSEALHSQRSGRPGGRDHIASILRTPRSGERFKKGNGTTPRSCAQGVASGRLSEVQLTPPAADFLNGDLAALDPRIRGD